MEIILFYLAAAIAIFSTVRVISNSNPIHALLNLVVSLLAVAMIFFMLGAPFAGALEIIVYAGAIMVLFVFVVMMLNLGQHTVNQEKQWMSPQAWLGASALAGILLAEMVYLLSQSHDHQTGYQLVDANPSSGTNYYRLKVVDLDGSVKYFKDIATIKIGGLGNGIKVYPVPTDNMLNVELMMSKDESIELSVYSLTGQQLMNETFILITGLNKLTTSLSSLPSTFQLIQM